MLHTDVYVPDLIPQQHTATSTLVLGRSHPLMVNRDYAGLLLLLLSSRLVLCVAHIAVPSYCAQLPAVSLGRASYLEGTGFTWQKYGLGIWQQQVSNAIFAGCTSDSLA
eukprot:GHRR01032494.1.p1 GENE.GHRR01032494.1~~GHRR01032494.1.p1  ORF type:complete len:109 (+),score=21.77 GHRR01032494.1:540-866(+)